MESPSPAMYIAIIALIGCSAFFSSCETVISTFNRIRMKKQAQDGNKSAQKVLDIADNYDRTLSSILIGNNIVNISASTIGTLVATALFGASGAIVSTVAMTILILTFGEILPKTYSIGNADRLALKFASPLGAVVAVLRPLSFVFSKLGTVFSDPDAEAAPSVTEEELMYFIESIEEEGIIEEQERELVQSALEFDETTIREVVTPRVNLVALDVESPTEEIMETILSEGYSRMPVFENSIDNIIGILYTKDYLRHHIRQEATQLKDMISEPYFVNKGMKLSLLLANLKSRKVNLAVVLDEYGGTLGIVTMEDLLEELVGEIWDEDDEIPEGLVSIDETHFEVTGEYDILDMLEELGYSEDDAETEHNTVSGWASQHLEHIPLVGETFDYQDLRFTILSMNGHRVARLAVEKYAAELPADGDTDAVPED